MARVEYRFREQAALAKESRAQEFQTTKGRERLLRDSFPSFDGERMSRVVARGSADESLLPGTDKVVFFEAKVFLTSVCEKDCSQSRLVEGNTRPGLSTARYFKKRR